MNTTKCRKYEVIKESTYVYPKYNIRIPMKVGDKFVSDMQFLLRVKIDSFMINTKTFKKTCDTYNVGLFEFMDINYLSFFKFYEYIKSNVMLETIERCALNLIRLELSNLIYTESHRLYEATIKAYIENKLDR